MAEKITCENCQHRKTCHDINLVSEMIIETVSAATMAMPAYGLREALASVRLSLDKLEELAADIPMDYEHVGGFMTGRGMEALNAVFKQAKEVPHGEPIH